ncbi:tRNA1(Val) (adenine(37)-N6)-methyltransferase [Azospirillum canadense]|uniref:tRNA1(Val) (adenine(37)-N6)-methyltransferase n=1 Tax=Azospirillum canadense TaxID=403962 RepID=UPI002227074A|nr:methyltransferase [Azospirillum canadense]MCW2237709.1 tRNA1(Val) A37 N6-methylase TrmN6 [Azospirillum canadense]
MTEPIDTLLDGRVRLIQPESGYRAAIDPVLLAAFTAAVAGDRVLDVGTGTGAAALCLAARVPGAVIVGLEKRAEAAEFARCNVALNAAGRVTVMDGDLLAPPPDLAPGGFDRVMMNPPYLRAGAASPPPDPWKAAANVEGEAGLADWLRFASAMLKPGGALTLVHRADRLDEILAALHGARFGSLILVPLWPKPGEDARRILLSARKGGRAPARFTAGLVLHDADGSYTAAAQRILRDMLPLAL